MSNSLTADRERGAYQIFHSALDILAETLIFLQDTSTDVIADLKHARAAAEETALRWIPRVNLREIHASTLLKSGSLPILRALPAFEVRVPVEAPHNFENFLNAAGPLFIEEALEKYAFDGELFASLLYLAPKDRQWIPLLDRIATSPHVLDTSLRAWCMGRRVSPLLTMLDKNPSIAAPVLSRQIAAEPAIGRELADNALVDNELSLSGTCDALRQLQACGAVLDPQCAKLARLAMLLTNHERISLFQPSHRIAQHAAGPIGG